MYDKTKEVLQALETVKKYCAERQCCNCQIVMFCDEYFNDYLPPLKWHVNADGFGDMEEDV